MSPEALAELFSLEGKVVVATGGGGVLVAELCRTLARLGARLAVLDINAEEARKVAAEIEAAGGQAEGYQVDVLDRTGLEATAARVIDRFGGVDVLINGAGGNRAGATTSKELSFFDLSADDVRAVFELNFTGSLIPCQVFGRALADRGAGAIVNISSMNAMRPLTRIPAYSAAKAAVSNFTQWLAVHMCTEYSPRIRVNAIAPGFFLTRQNRFLLTERETSGLTPRGRTIIEHTPMGRFGEPADLAGCVAWLLSPSASFVTGIVVPLDGGFSAYGGV
ncbi:MAG TPA: SDR family oxidoreductase [Myxococcota bacterium]|nr:SDR family oxidoreductase [Myxococcota bacterium]